MKLKRSFASLLALMLTLSTLICLFSCVDSNNVDDRGNTISDKDTDTETDAAETLDYSDITAEDFVEAVSYKGLAVILETDSEQEIDAEEKQTALWEVILATAKIKSYPKDKIDYYFNQRKNYFLYLAKNEEDYPLILKHFNTNEEKMTEEAESFVAKDLVYLYIVQKENIKITQEEKAELFDKYVEKYVNDYGYQKEYVLANMTELIYDSMQYDKTVEFLMANNTFEKAVPSDTDNKN